MIDHLRKGKFKEQEKRKAKVVEATGESEEAIMGLPSPKTPETGRSKPWVFNTPETRRSKPWEFSSQTKLVSLFSSTQPWTKPRTAAQSERNAAR